MSSVSKTEREIIRTEYLISRREVVDNCYRVEANSMKEAIEKIEDYEVERDEIYHERYYKPVVTEVVEYVACPNKGQGWTSVAIGRPIPIRQESGEYSWNSHGDYWHFNGLCKGEMVKTEAYCNRCISSKKEGYRFLTRDEKAYLSDRYQYNVDINKDPIPMVMPDELES